MIDFSKKYNRLFAIGCSFTHYRGWPTWAAALSTELNIPLYNLGHSGASNKYIQSQLFLLDNKYKLTSDDLVITQWTSHARLSVLGDSFYSDSMQWEHWGPINDLLGIFTKEREQAIAEIIKYQTYNTMLLDSLIAIKSSILYQNTLPCDCVNLQMEDVAHEKMLMEDVANEKTLKISGRLMPSFVSLLYPGYTNYTDVLANLTEIHTNDKLPLHSKYRKRNLFLKAKKSNTLYDMHPLPTEHVAYLENIFDHSFSNTVKQLAKEDEQKWINTPADQPKAVHVNRDNTYYKLESLQQVVSLPG